MNKRNLILAAAVLAPAFAATAFAADQTVSASAEYTDLGTMGERSIVSAEYVHKDDRNTFVVHGAHGERNFPRDVSASDTRLGATIYTRWSDQISTRFGGAWGSDEPVFAKSDYSADVNFAVVRNTLLTVGGRRASYFGNVDVTSWNAGATYYFAGGSVMYRFTRYDSDLTGTDNGHTARITLKDGGTSAGRTELWLGYGDRTFSYDWTTEFLSGSTRSIALRRVQPLSGTWALNVTAGHTRYETPFIDYNGNTLSAGLQYGW